MAKPTLLRTVAQLLPRRREYQDEYMAVLTRTGEDGADALIEQLTNAQSLAERRVYFDSLLLLNAGIPALVHMLGDARWYVARNAADLLGEMQAAEAEGPLAELLKHDDDRVRRAAANALAKIGTPKAVQGLHVALRDTSPDVRKQAAAGLALRKGQKSANTLSRALDDEGDAEVQLEILRALGRLATPDAVQKLVKAAEPEGRLFKKKAVAYRVAAVRALGEARTPAALTALQSLVNDREREVREAVFQVMVQAGSGNPEKAGA
jgi:HEAT repeat protein